MTTAYVLAGICGWFIGASLPPRTPMQAIDLVVGVGGVIAAILLSLAA